MEFAGNLDDYEPSEKSVITSLRNRIETKILKQLKTNLCMPLTSRFSQYFGINKNSDLIKNSLVKIDNSKVLLTKNGKKFIKWN